MYAVISDVHSNIEALTAVLSDIQKKATGAKLIFLGDAVGYGPNPNECVSVIRDSTSVAVAGNHDWGLLGLTPVDFFNQYAKSAILWSRTVITRDSEMYLKSLPLVARLEGIDAFLAHSSPKEPQKWHYIVSGADCAENLAFFAERAAIVGHSHMPFIAEVRSSGESVFLGTRAEFSSDARYVINSGSVGQPRDGDPRACWLLIDESCAEIMRVPYDIEKTRSKIQDAGLPAFLSDRLPRGR